MENKKMSKRLWTVGGDKVRILHFIRHGDYDNKNSREIGGRLTEFGKEQTKYTAEYIKNSIPVDTIYSSDLNRAVETAQIIQQCFPQLEINISAHLREILPSSHPNGKVPLYKRRGGKEQLEKAVSCFFKPAEKETHEIFVCHGNFIRSLLCVVQKVPITSWHKYFSYTFNCAITSFAVYKSRVQLVQFNLVSHLPNELVT